MAIREEIDRQSRIARVMGDYRGRLSAQGADYESIAKSMASDLAYNPAGKQGGIPAEGKNSVQEIQRILQMQGATGERDREALLMSAAHNRAPGIRERVHGTLARDDWQGRTAQTALGVSIVGGTAGGLTAAGQGLMALMSYLQQGQEVEAEREQPLA